MNEQERNKILEKSKEFFREEIVTNHIKNIKKNCQNNLHLTLILLHINILQKVHMVTLHQKV